MKRISHAFTFLTLLLLVSGQNVNATQVIDRNTVYAPKINVCVASFGDFIQSREIIVKKEAGTHILRTKDLLNRWIYEFNTAGFYLQEFESSQYYWQFVETKKYVGAILIVTGDTVKQEFYDILGSGLNTSGKSFYGLHSPAGMNGDVFSFVVRKEDYVLEHFENWKFTEETGKLSSVSTGITMNLLTKSEHKFLNQVCKKSKGEFIRHNDMRLAYNPVILKRDTLPKIDK